MNLPEPPRPDLRPPPPTPPKKPTPSWGYIVAMVIAGLLVLGWIISAVDGDSSSSDSSDALVERTCEIARDISSDAADDTVSETRARFKDLLDGYGEAAPADLQTAIRDTEAALTAGDLDALESAVDRLDSACAARGY